MNQRNIYNEVKKYIFYGWCRLSSKASDQFQFILRSPVEINEPSNVKFTNKNFWNIHAFHYNLQPSIINKNTWAFIPYWAPRCFKNSLIFSTKHGQPHESGSSYGPSPTSHHSQFPISNACTWNFFLQTSCVSCHKGTLCIRSLITLEHSFIHSFIHSYVGKVIVEFHYFIL